MKSLLLDVLRQADIGDSHDTGQSLSDSGSFSTDNPDNSEFGETANDELVDTENSISDELELLQMTGALIVSDDVTQENEPPSDAVILLNGVGDEALDPRSYNARSTVIERAPALARNTPMLCILLAIVAFGCSFVFQQVDIRYFLDVFASEHSQPSVGDRASVVNQPTYGNSNERFPFLDVPLDDVVETSDVSGPVH